MAKDWAGWVGAMIGVIGLGFAAQQYFFGTFATTKIDDIRGGRSCAGFLINDELPADAKPTTLDEDEIKRLKEKIECYRDQIEKNPNDAIAFTNRGEAKRSLGRLREALVDQEKARQLNGNLQEAKLGMSLVEGNLGNTKAANRAIQDAVAQKESAIAYFYQGIILGEQKDWKSAEASFRKAINLNPNDVNDYSTLGVALDAQGKTAEAIAAYRKAISLNPNNAVAYTNLGVALREQGKTAEAIVVYQKAISLNSKDAITYYNLGIALGEQGKTAEAIAAYQKAISLNPNIAGAYYAGAYYNLGGALGEQGKTAEAIAAFQKAIGINPNDAETHNNLGVALARQGNVVDAISNLKKARELFRTQGKTQQADKITQILEQSGIQ